QRRRGGDAEQDHAAAALRRQSSRRHPDDYRIVAGEHDVDDDHRQERARLVHTGQHDRDISMDRGSVDPTRMLIETMPQEGTAIRARLGAFYAASFLVVGIQTPFWPVWLAGRGLDAQEIAALFAAGIWAKVAATPLIGAAADRLGNRRGVMAALATVACLAYAALWPEWGFWGLLWLNLVAGVAQSALMPLGDSITLAAVRGSGLDYGRIRIWGSLSFIVAAIGSGALLGGPAARS